MSTTEKSSHMFSGTAKNVLLAFVFAVYLLAGAYIFQILEREAESNVKVKTERHKLEFLKNYTCLTEDAVKQLINVVTEAVQQGVNPLANSTTSHHSNWDFGSSFFFAGTVVTTIGYGTIAPRTVGGQVFCIAYALFGIPLNIIVLSHVGKSLSHWCKRFAKILVKKGINKKTAKVLTIIFFLLMGMIIFLGIPPLLFTKTEGWTYEEGVYYAFISLSTIGFGDYVVGSGKKREAPFEGYRGLVFFWIIFGLAWLSLLINLLTSLLEDTEKLAEDLYKKVKHRKERKQETAILETVHMTGDKHEK